MFPFSARGEADGGWTAQTHHAATGRATIGVPVAEKVLGFFRVGTAGWLLYLTWAVTLNFSAGYHLTL
jgi:hypothetical protein